MDRQKLQIWALPVIQTISIEQMLATPIENGYLFHQPKYFYNYIADHASEFLDIAINENLTHQDFIFGDKGNGTAEGEKSRNSFLLLSNSPKNVMDELLVEGRFLIKATTILTQVCTYSSYHLAKSLASRVASIFTNIITKTKDKDIIVDSVGFLTHMIRFMEDPVIFDLFHLMVSINDDFKEMQGLLSQVKLYDFVLDELSSDAANDPVALIEKQKNLCIFIQDCLKNPILRDSFQNEKILKKLTEMLKYKQNVLVSQSSFEYGNIEIRLINNIWEALSLIPCRKLMPKMQDITSLSIGVIKHLIESTISQDIPSIQTIEYNAHKFIRKYHVCAFDLISKVAILNPSTIDINGRNILIQSTLKTIDAFPNSTNLITAAFRVVKSSLLCSEFAKMMVETLMPKMISLARSSLRTAASAAATHFLADMDKTKSSSTMINSFLTTNNQYMSFYQSYFKHYLEEAYVPYGGPVSKCVRFEIEKAKKMKQKLEQKILKKLKKSSDHLEKKADHDSINLKKENIVY